MNRMPSAIALVNRPHATFTHGAKIS